MSTTITRTLDTSFVESELRRIIPEGQLTELRALDAVIRVDRRSRPVVSGYYDNVAALARDVATIASACGIYYIPNPIDPRLHARAANRLRTEGKIVSTTDADIVQRNWLLIDIDAGLPADISSTDAEHSAALALATRIADELGADGWPSPILADSGNGAHLMYRVCLQRDDGGLSQKCLQALAARYDVEGGPHIDQTTFNAARIWKLPGTVAAKGDSTEVRPHRVARLLDVPQPLTSIPLDLLHALARQAPQPEQPQKSQSNGQHEDYPRLDMPRYLADRGQRFTTKQLQERTAYILAECPLDQSHGGGGEVAVFQWDSGKTGFECKHSSCAGRGWQEFKQQIGPPEAKHYDRPPSRNGSTHQEFRPHDRNEAEYARVIAAAPSPTITPIHFGEMVKQYPKLRSPIIEGLQREAETANIIAPPKYGKSWATYGLAWSIVTGADWLGRFPCRKGRVLLIDNELHKETLTSRIACVARAMGIDIDKHAGDFDILPLRGKSLDLHAIADAIEKLEAGAYTLSILDSWYRALPAGVSENDNAQVTELYNTIDRVAEMVKMGWWNVHHSSKGSQTDKAITDVGSGAGAQSRAADCHAILRQHEEPGVVVLEAVLRSFAPVDPRPLRFQFPLWVPATDVDPSMLKGRLTRSEEKKQEKDKEGMQDIFKALQKAGKPLSTRDAVAESEMGQPRFERLAARLAREGHVIKTTGVKVGGNTATTYEINPTSGWV